MNANEFWCRAFLAAMGDYVDDPEACEDAANTALAVAQRRGMVDGGAEPRQEPELERVEFRAERDGDWWLIGVLHAGSDYVFRVMPGEQLATFKKRVNIRIKWGETMPPKPIEVWIERKAGA